MALKGAVSLKELEAKHGRSPKHEERVQKNILNYNLKRLYRDLELTEEEVAKLKVDHVDTPQLQDRQELLLATFRKYVKALGGELEVTAVFPNKRVPMRGV